MTKTVDIAALPLPLAELVALALAGTEVVFAANEQPLLRLTRDRIPNHATDSRPASR